MERMERLNEQTSKKAIREMFHDIEENLDLSYLQDTTVFCCFDQNDLTEMIIHNDLVLEWLIPANSCQSE